MSNYEWIIGEVVLPSNTVAETKRSFRNKHNEIIMSAYDQLKRFRVDNLTSSVPKWLNAITLVETPEKLSPSTRIAMYIARNLDKPRAAKWDDFDEQNWGRAGVSQSEFPLFSHNGHQIGKAIFKGRILTWEIYEDNYAVDIFNDSIDSEFLYKTLNSIEWTRGSGGAETYWNETLENTKISKFWGSKGRRAKPKKRKQSEKLNDENSNDGESLPIKDGTHLDDPMLLDSLVRKAPTNTPQQQ